MKVAYLVNQYPHVTHSFIRREIEALERAGLPVQRHSIRASSSDLVDEADLAEKAETSVLLSAGPLALAGAAAAAMVTRPLKFLRAARTAVRMGRRSNSGVLRHLGYLAEACLLRRRLRQSGADHLHAHFGTNSAAVALLTRLLGGPTYSLTIHGSEEFDRPESLSLGDKISGAAFVVAVSRFGRSQIMRWCPHTDWPKLGIVRCGIDSAYRSADPSPVPDNNRLVCVGRLCEQKGQLLLVQAVAHMIGAGRDVRLTLAGDGPMRRDVEAEIRRLNVGDRVRITGWISNADVRREILASRGVVVSSLAENLPVVLMEALALGRPAISTSIAGIPELVRDGVCGRLIPPGSVGALADAMSELLDTPADELTRMGRAGATLVAEQHDVAVETAKLASYFRAAADHPDDPLHARDAAGPRPQLVIRLGSSRPADATPHPAGQLVDSVG